MSRPNSRPVSRSNSISEAPITIPVDPRVQAIRPGHADRDASYVDRATHWLKKDGGKDSHEHSHRRHNDQDPKLFGPGFSSAAPHTAEGNVRYVLVTPEMMAAIESGNAPQTELVHPAGTTLESNAAMRHRNAYQSNPISRVQTQIGTPHDHAGPAITSSAVAAAFSASSQMEKHEKGELTELSVGPDGFSDIAGGPPQFPNRWAKIRNDYKEPFAEFLGTAILIIFGNGVNCQVVLSNLTQGSYLSISHGWGIGVMAGVYAAGGISGAHLSPAVTISLAAFRGFPWRKVPAYALAQILGACFGSCLIQGNYHALLNQFEGGYNLRTFGTPTSTATLFFTGPQPYMSNIGAFCSEVLATAVLLFLILSLGDANNNPAPAGMNGVILYLIIMGIGAALGTETAYCLNPARDLGPRIAAAMYGYPSTIWTDRNCYWIYVPIIATITGGLIGSFFYDAFIFSGAESPLNKPFSLPWSSKKRQEDLTLAETTHTQHA